MTNPDYRALCAELLAAIQLYTKLNHAASDMSPFELTEKLMDAMAATDAALAQPVAEEPTDEELDRLWWQYVEAPDVVMALGKDGFRRASRVLLSRWGRPTPQPVAVSERWPRAKDCDEQGRCWWHRYTPTKEWHLQRVYIGQYNYWLPANALPIPITT